MAGIAFERALISEHEATQARARSIALTEAGVCGRAIDDAVAQIASQCGGSAAYAFDLVSALADEAHSVPGAPRERTLDLLVPQIAKRYGRSDAVVSRDLRRAGSIARKTLTYSDNVPTALTRLLGLRGELPGLLVRLAGSDDATVVGAQDTRDFAIDAIAALGRAGGPRRASNRDGVFERPAVTVRLRDILPGLYGVLGAAEKQAGLNALSIMASEARRADVLLLLEATDEANLSSTVDLFVECRSEFVSSSWDGLGLSIAAESKRALDLLTRLHRLAGADNARLPLRLTRSETIATDLLWAIASGISDYPVAVTPSVVSTQYVACARALLSEPRSFYPMFDQATAAERGLIEAVGAGKSYDIVMGGHLLGAANADVFETVGGGQPRFSLDVGNRDAALARYRDVASAPRLINALLQAGGAPTSDAESPYLAVPMDPLGEVGELLDTAVEASSTGPVAVDLVPPNACGEGSLCVVRDPVDQPDYCLAPVGRFAAADDNDAGPRDQATLAVDLASQPSWEFFSDSQRAQVFTATGDALHRRKSDVLNLLVDAGLLVRHAEAEWLKLVEALRAAAISTPSEAPVSRVGPAHLAGHSRAVGHVVIAVDVSYLFSDAATLAIDALAFGNRVSCVVPDEAVTYFRFLGGMFAAAGLPQGAFLAGNERSAFCPQTLDVGHSNVVVAGDGQLHRSVMRSYANSEPPLPTISCLPVRSSLALIDGTVSLPQVAATVASSIADFAGQRRNALRTLIVAEDVAEVFSEQLIDALAQLEPGEARDTATRLGPMLSDVQRDAANAEKLRLMQQATLIFDGDMRTELIARPYVSSALFSAVEPATLITPRVVGPLIGLNIVNAEDFHGGAELLINKLTASQPFEAVAVFSRDEQLFDAVSKYCRAASFIQDAVPYGTSCADAFFGTTAVGHGVFGLAHDPLSSMRQTTTYHRPVVS